MPIKVLLMLSSLLLTFSACVVPNMAPSVYYPAGPHAGASYSGSYHSGAPAVYNHEPTGVVSVQPQAPWQSYAMYSDYEFNAFLETLRAESFDSKRLEMVQRAARSVAFYSDQVALLIGCLKFESHRIDAAVMLYPRTVDSKNWHLIQQSFSFASSFSDVEKKIAHMRPLG